METVSEAVAWNVYWHRYRGRLSVRQLSAVLAELGRRLLPSTITKIEKQQRKVDVDELVDLALALNCTPNALLMPAAAGRAEGVGQAYKDETAGRVWAWLAGEAPLRDDGSAVAVEDFRRNSMPEWVWTVESDSLVRAARVLLDAARAAVSGPATVSHLDAGEASAMLVTDLRAALRVVVAEVDRHISGVTAGWPAQAQSAPLVPQRERPKSGRRKGR